MIFPPSTLFLLNIVLFYLNPIKQFLMLHLDKLPLNIEENLMFQHLGRYLTSVHVFPYPILFLAGLKPLWKYGQQRPAIMAGGKEITADFGESSKPELFVVHPKSIAARIKDRKFSDDNADLPDVLELKDATAFHLKISVDNDVNSRFRELLQSLSTLESKVTFLEAEKARLEAVEVSFRKEVEELKQDRRNVASKIVSYAVMELVHSDDMGSLVGRLVSRYLMWEANNDFATATFPWLDEFMANPSAPIKALLSKKPPSLQRHAPSRTQVPLPSF
nr:hypothetical protein [Tanacetum cinerariifolium]